jgi:hypothetical protein
VDDAIGNLLAVRQDVSAAPSVAGCYRLTEYVQIFSQSIAENIYYRVFPNSFSRGFLWGDFDN